jgi:hypothetical protein
MPRKMLIANDGSDGAALTAATALAMQAKAELHMVCVEELPRFPASIEEVTEEKQETKTLKQVE